MNAPIRTLRLPVEGMTCASCVRRVETAIAAVPGVEAASVNLATEAAEVRFAAPADAAAIRAAVAKAGYGVPSEEVDLAIEGATCASCVRRIETALARVPGVEAASVNLAAESARVQVLRGTDTAALVAAVGAAGYAAALRGEAPERETAEAGLLRRTAWAAALTLPVVVLEMGGHLVPAWHHLVGATLGHDGSWLIQLVLTTLVLALPGRVFLSHGLPALLRGAPDMNALVALGAGAAWLYSSVVVVAPEALPAEGRQIYFEAAAVIVTLVLTGRWLEARARGRTGAAIRRLVGLTPALARVQREGGAVEEVPVERVRPGDLLELRPGERVAVDGVVTEGESAVDEAMLTGEPVPVGKRPGAALSAGTVNGTGALSYRATAVGAETRLAQIVRLVEAAQGAKLPVQHLVDRITQWFVPAVIAVAAVTVLVWLAVGPSPAHALVAGVGVLIIACPCAMGLAVPVSIMVGTGRGAELGLLFRRGDALQALAGVRRVVFDKTGTLTEGRPALVETALLGDADGLLARVAAAELKSEHPLAAALVAAADGPLPAMRGFRSVTGQGVVAEVDGRRIAVGNARLMQAEGVDPGAFAAADEMAGRGRTAVLVAEEGRPAAVLGIADPVKATSAEAVRTLRGEGVAVAMLSGDSPRTTAAVAAGLAIAEARGGLSPEAKLAAVREWQSGGPVAFVGDGINDAPVLAGADVGIALGTGTDVAIEAAELVLMSGDPRGVPRALGLSRAVMRNIYQNLAWAFGYNVLLIPVAAGVLYPAWGVLLSPALGAGAMALSSVLVVTNALRLRRWGGEA
jgi:heavy metal translocating P-type ATPase